MCTVTALRRLCAIDVALRTATPARISQQLSRRAAICFLLGQNGELLLCVVAAYLVTAVEHRNVWLNLLGEQPGQKLARAVALVGLQALRLQPEAPLHTGQHLASGHDLLTEACRCSLDIKDDAFGIVDQVMGIVGKLRRPVLG